MLWIDKLFPVFTLIIGWGLSEFGKFSVEKRNNRKKLKRLLFNLLELRWLLKMELDLNKEITNYIEKLEIKLVKELGLESVDGSDLVKTIIAKIVKDKIVETNRIKEIESNIDKTIIELAEIYPIFAYELSGTYKIKERLEGAESYFNEVAALTEEMPEELKDWIKPELSNGLLNELDTYIIAIAKKINKKTKNNVSNKLLWNGTNDTEETDKFIDDYIKKIKALENRDKC